MQSCVIRWRKIRPACWFSLALSLCLLPVVSQGVPFPETENKPVLNEDHRQWLEAHDRLRLGIPVGRSPLAYENAFGRVLGTESGYARLLERKLGIPVEMVGGTPMALEEKLARGELDALSMMSAQTWSSRQYRFTRPYMRLTYGIFARRDDASISSLSSLEGKRIVLLDGDHHPFELLDPVQSFTPVAARSLDEAMTRLINEEADAFLAPVPVGKQYLQDNQLTSVHQVYELDERPMTLSYAVPFDQGVVRGLLDAAITAMTGTEHRNIRGAWVGIDAPLGQAEQRQALTFEERTWLIRNPGLKVAMRSGWAPLEFLDNGVVAGLVPDVLALIEKELGYKFERVALDDWNEAGEQLADGRVDIIAALPRTPRRQERFLFSRSYLSLPIALVIRDDFRFVGDLSELRDEVVGVVRDLASHEYLLLNHPDLNLKTVESNEAGLLAVASGELDVMVTHIPGVSYILRQLELNDLRISSITPYQYDLRFGVNPEQPELAGILNKALANIDRADLDEIYNRWIHMDIESPVDYTVVQRVVLLALLVVAVFLYWNRKLSLEVDERVRSEHALRQSEDALLQAKQDAESLAREAESANRAKSEFLANMSHEIRTPMNAVLGYTELLERSLTDPKQRGYLASIKAGSRSLLTLINDILDLSRVEAGKMRLEFAPVDPKRLLEDVRHIFAIRAREKGLTLTFEIPQNLPRALVLDETRLRQVLFNLVGNAIKFTREGEVTVRAEVQRKESSDAVNITISVADTGIGIPENQQARIFEAFEQQEGQSNRQYGGTGLGLAISRKLIEMMKGRLDVQSTEGVGSVFTVRLFGVRVAWEEGAEQQSDATPVRFFGGRVLVVDDNHINRQLVRDILEPEGLVVDEADHGRTALMRAREVKPDLILMDIRMPVMNGYEARAALQAEEGLEHIPVVALTASVMDSESARIREAGFHGYLRKPMGRQDLLSELARFLPHENHMEAASDASGFVAWTDLPAGRQQAVKERVASRLGTQALALRDSGDPEALGEFAGELTALSRQEGVSELWQLAQQLADAVEAFDLDRVSELLKLVLQWADGTESA